MRAQFAAWFVLSCGILHAQSGTGITTFHVDRQRSGWWPGETTLTPANVSGGNFGPIWNSVEFDVVGGVTPHAYATPLYLRSVTMSAGQYAGGTFNVVFAATSNGFTYAVAASAATMGTTQVPAGTILWRKSLGIPAQNINGDQVPLGVLSTPVIDPATNPPRLYVACADATAGWQGFALDVTSGNVLPGWPLAINNSTVSPLNQNGPSTFQPTNAVSQRGALNLSPDGKYLYIPFGGYTDSSAGWLVIVDTRAATIASAFSGAPSTAATANAGMWAASGVAIDPAGNVYSTTGNGSTGNESTPGYWGNSFLAWKPGVPLTLSGTYTPFNYCQMDVGDIDVAGGGAILIPNLGLAAFGGKQGNVYLVSLNSLPGNLLGRQGCGNDASKDTSRLPPGNQPQFGTPGPLNVFGPYSETNNNLDYAKARTTPAFFQGADGTPYLFASGSNKASATSQTSVPPGICRLKIVTGSQPYLAIDACEPTITFMTPGSPVVTSNGTLNAILWELVANIPRSQVLNGSSKPFLLALDPITMNVLFKSSQGQLNEGGKYNSPLVVDGTVFIATDRIQAFGILPPSPPPVITSFVSTLGSIVAGQSTTLSWSATRATTFSVNGNAVNGTSLTVSPTQTTVYTLTAANSGGSATATTTVSVTGPPPPLPPTATLIDSCGPAVSPFVADELVVGGNCTTINVSVSFTPNASCPTPPLQVFQTKRTGNTGNGIGFTYTIPNLTPNQSYEVCLYFMDDLNSTAGNRVFGVKLNGTTALNNFDVAGTAGGINKAIVEALTATPDSQNQIAIQLVYGSAGNPIVSAVAVVPMSGPPPVITSFVSTPASIISGQSATLSWSATGAATFSVNGNGVNGTSLTVSPTQTTVYTLIAANSGGSATATTTVAVTVPPPPPGGPAWYNTSWTNRKAITINHAQVSGSSNLTNFPVLFSVTDVNLATVSNGGKVGKSDGSDILFTASDGATKLNHELESYTASNGKVIAWVQVPTVSTTADTVIYIYYGNASAASQQNATGVWDSNYKGVWHLPNGTTLGLTDSTSNGNNGANNGATATTGEIDGAANLVRANSQSVAVPDSASLEITGSWTISAWINLASTPSNDYLSGIVKGNTTNYELVFDNGTASGGPGWVMGLQDEATANFYWAKYSVSPTVGTWYYLTGVWDDANHLQTLYLNGSAVATMDPGAGVHPAIDNTNVSFGQDPCCARGYMDGKIDEPRISATVRSAGWVRTEYNNQNSSGAFYSVGPQQ